MEGQGGQPRLEERPLPKEKVPESRHPHSRTGFCKGGPQYLWSQPRCELWKGPWLS